MSERLCERFYLEKMFISIFLFAKKKIEPSFIDLFIGPSVSFHSFLKTDGRTSTQWSFFWFALHCLSWYEPLKICRWSSPTMQQQKAFYAVFSQEYSLFRSVWGRALAKTGAILIRRLLGSFFRTSNPTSILMRSTSFWIFFCCHRNPSLFSVLWRAVILLKSVSGCFFSFGL